MNVCHLLKSLLNSSFQVLLALFFWNLQGPSC
jgi:hypothetical protein